jgi:hypothetical protein
MLTATRGPVVTEPATWHAAIAAFKRALIERAIAAAGGNRTRAARSLSLQRTYLLRLMREMGVPASMPAPARGCSSLPFRAGRQGFRGPVGGRDHAGVA